MPKILDHKIAPKCNKTQRTQRSTNQNFRCWSPRPQVRRVHQAAAPRSNGWGMCIARGKQLSRAFDDEMGLWSLWAIPPATIQVMSYQDEHNLFRSRSQPSLDAWTSRWQGYSILPFLSRERRPRGRVEGQPPIFC